MPKEPLDTVRRNGSARRGGAEGGFTLIELLIVVGVIGILAIIATLEVSKTLKKQRLDAQSQEIKGFIDSSYLESQRLRVPVFCQLQPISNGSWWIARYADDGGFPAAPVSNLQLETGTDTLLQRKSIPSDLCFSRTSINTFETPPSTPPATGPVAWSRVNGNPTLLCTVAGQSLQPNQAQAMLTMRVMQEPLTHVEMVEGALSPKFAYMIQITPLFSCTVVRQNY